jgi:MFS family permease
MADEPYTKFSKNAEPYEENLSAWQWVSRFKHLLLIAAIMALQMCLISSQSTFITTTWFARQHVDKGEHLNCNDTPDSRPSQEGAADYAYWSGILSGISSFFSIFSAITLGSLSDAIGRYKVIKVSLLLDVFSSCALMAVVFFDMSLWVYLIAGTIESCFDVNGVWLAIVADLTRDQRRQRGPVLGSSFVLVIVLACICMPLASMLSFRIATSAATILSIVVLCYVHLMMEDTLPQLNPTENKGVDVVIGELKQAISLLRRNSFMQRMVAVLTLSGVAFAAKFTIMRPYMMAHFGMNKNQMALLIPVMAPSICLCFTVGLWTVVPRFGEVRILQASFCIFALQTATIMAANSPWQIYASYGLLTGPAFLCLPVINAIKSNLCSDQDQGKVQGLIAAVRGFSVSFADVAFGALYKWTTDGGKHTEGARTSLWVVLALCIAAAVLTLSLPEDYPKPDAFPKDYPAVVPTPEDPPRDVQMTSLDAAVA